MTDQQRAARSMRNIIIAVALLLIAFAICFYIEIKSITDPTYNPSTDTLTALPGHGEISN